MTTSDEPKSQSSTEPFSAAVAVAWLKENWPRYWYVGLYAFIVLVAAGLRLWKLGMRSFNHDESLHATYSWYLYVGRGYQHDPMMHGPFQFHLIAGMWKLLTFLSSAPIISSFAHWGPSDYTARLPAALFGIGLVTLPYFFRGYIGRFGALLAALFLAFSPTILYFSRFTRNDIFIGFFSLAIVICMWRYMTERRPLYLYLIAALLALSFATKEVTFMTSAMFLLYLDLLFAWELLERLRGRAEPPAAEEPVVEGKASRRARKKDAPPPLPAQRKTPLQWALVFLCLAPVAWLIAITWPLTGKWRERRSMNQWPVSGDLLVLVGTLSAAQFAAAVQVLPFIGNKGYYRDVAGHENTVMKTSVFLLIAISAYIGFLWRPRTWLIAAGIFYAIFVLLYTTFFTNMGGFWSGIWGSLDYWLAQQGVQRGSQPHYYYLMILTMYEFLPLVFAAVGVVFFALKRQLFTTFLIFWVIASLAAFALAGEKMPWLTVHIAIPIIILAAKFLDTLFDRFRIWLPFQWRNPETLVLLAAAAGFLSMAIFWATGFSVLGAIIALLLGLGVAGLIGRAIKLHGRLLGAQAAAALIIPALFVITVRDTVRANYDLGTWPREILSYADTAPGMPWARDQLVNLGKDSGLGRNYPIVVDNEVAWPMVWYLRDYKPQWASTTMSPPTAGSIVIVGMDHKSWMDPYLDDYQEPVSIRHLWWFGDGPQHYQGVTVSSFIKSLFKERQWDVWRDYFVWRKTPWAPPPDDTLVYLPKQLATASATPIKPAPALATVTVAPANLLAIGSAGADPGQLNEPTDVSVDAAGNVYVSDARNNRIEKFDASGKLLGILGPGGDKPATMTEPWSVAVAPDGSIYIADTWAHRILKYDANFNLVWEKGRPFADLGRRKPEIDELFGPRDILVLSNGNILVADTGNKRVVEFSANGDAILSFGSEGTGQGQFNEPVGLALGPNGNVYVADTWNGRVESFDANFKYVGEFAVKGWSSTEVTAKPYLAVLPDGRVIVSNPANGRVEIYNQYGKAALAWDLPLQQSGEKGRPVGLALDGKGFLFIADCLGNKVYRIPVATLTGP